MDPLISKETPKPPKEAPMEAMEGMEEISILKALMILPRFAPFDSRKNLKQKPVSTAADKISMAEMEKISLSKFRSELLSLKKQQANDIPSPAWYQEFSSQKAVKED